MIRGMTGFGSAQFAFGKIKGVIEVKSVNHRFLDLSFYLPVGFGSLEGKIRELLGQDLTRGRVTITIKITEKPGQSVTFNEDMIEEYLRHARSIEKKYRLTNNLTLADLISMPGVVEVREIFIEAPILWPSIEKGLKTAFKGLGVMRCREGKSLSADINDKLKRMTIRLKGIEKRSQDILKNRQKTMKTEEFASFQKGIDINEEIARFHHYIAEMKDLLCSSVPVGKKLDFIAQEMQREANTMGSKLQDEMVTNAVVALKSKIEKIREQANNIE